MNFSVVLVMLYASAVASTTMLCALQEAPAIAESVMQQALRDFEQKRYAEVIRGLEGFVRVYPFHAAGHHVLGLAYVNMGDSVRGFSAMRTSLELDPGNAAFALNLAKAFLAQGQTGSAKETLEAAIGVRETPELCRMLGLVYLELEKGEQAFGFLERASKLDPRDAVSWYYMGLIHHAYNHFDDAVECYRKAIALKPSDFLSHFQLGKLYETLQNWQGAVAELEAAERLQKKHAGLYTHLAGAYLRTNRLDEALKAGQRAVELAPADPLAHYQLGKVLARLGRQAEARVHLRYIDGKATETEPTLSEHWEKMLKPEKP